jgi:hypothetical protein
MARRKETIWQRDFGSGAVRPEAVERDDTSLIDTSTKEALNTITLTSGQVVARPGTVSLGSTSDATDFFEVDLGGGRQYELYLTPDGYEIYDPNGVLIDEETGFTWTSVSPIFGAPAFEDFGFWVVADPDGSRIIVGSRYIGLQQIAVDGAGAWSIGAAPYEASLSGGILQPYYQHYRGLTLAPSARTGSITVTANGGIWMDSHAGLYVRYVDQTIRLDARVSATVMNATVIEELPPTYDITVASASGYKVGDAVEHSVLGGQGIITGIAGSVVTVLATSSYDGFDASGKLVAPNAAQNISGISVASSPAASFLWDIQMFSAVHGFAGWGSRHGGRLYQCDLAGAPQAFSASDAGSILAVAMGANDADGFVETIGSDVGGVLKYIISAEDLVFLTTRGIYYQPSRDGSVITPTTISPTIFSTVGTADVRPVAVDEGLVFIDAVGEQVWGAVLTGDVYKSWRARMLTKYHGHLMNGPVKLGGTTSGSKTPEQFIYVVNSDGSAAVCQWDRDEDKLSWRPWDTEGNFLVIDQVFGKVNAIVERDTSTGLEKYRETFFGEAVMDAVRGVKVSNGNLGGQEGQSYFGGTTAYATHLNGLTATASVYFEGWDYGDLDINAGGRPLDADGNVFDYEDYDGIAQVGLNFIVRIVPWARRSVNTQRGTRDVKRIVEMYVTVLATGTFKINGDEFGAYRVGEDLSEPPPLRDQQYRVGLAGGSSFEEIPIERVRPGPFQVLKVGYRVVI